MLSVPKGLIVALGAAVVAGGPLAGQPAEPPARRFMRTVVGFTPADFQALDGGQVVTRQIQTKEKGEVAAFGAVTVNAAPEAFFKAAEDIVRFRSVPEILEIGRFSSPPRVEDLDGLHFPEEDLESLRKCRPGKCFVKLGDPFLERIAGLDWSAPGTRAKVERWGKEALVEHLKAYQAGGTAALGVLVDKDHPKALANEFNALLANSPYFVEYIPEFNAYVRDYPKGQLAGTRDAFYWTKDQFGLKPTVSVHHVTIQRRENGALVADKLLYATHYFNSGLEFWALAEVSPGNFRMLQIYRTRLDPPTGMLAGVLLGKVRDGVETGLKANLKNAKAKTEAAAR